MSNRLRVRHKSTRLYRPLKAPNPYTGQYFYKYRTVQRLDWLEEILLKDTLYFPTAAELKRNDPKEARPRLVARSYESLVKWTIEWHLKNGTETPPDVIDSELRSQFPTKSELLHRMETQLHEHTQGFHIYSVGRSWDNAHLWKEYAGDHAGYVLEFRNEPSMWKAFEVRYDDVVVDVTRPEASNPHFLLYKNRQWHKEDEVRLLGLRDFESRITFDPGLLTRAIFGRNIQPCHAATIREMASRRSSPLRIVSESDL